MAEFGATIPELSPSGIVPSTVRASASMTRPSLPYMRPLSKRMSVL